jgi:hypothetical protein
MASKKISLASLAAQIEKGFASAADDIADIRETLTEHTQILKDHTRRLRIIENDVKTNLDKRLTLQVRVTNLEKKVFGSSQEPAHQ